MAPHGLVHKTALADDLRMIAELAGLKVQIVWVHANTMSPYEAGVKGHEVPFGLGGFDDLKGANAHAAEDERALVHEGYVDVPLGVL